MELEIYTYTNKNWNSSFNIALDSKNTLIVIFGSSKKELVNEPLNKIREQYPNSNIIGASTSGEILQDEIFDDGLVVAVMKFETTTLKVIETSIESVPKAYDYGVKIGEKLLNKDLKSVFILSDGLNMNGSQLTRGISSVLSSDVVVTGGLAGDDDRFQSTWVMSNGKAKSNIITAVGFYGDDIHIGFGSRGGWDRLGIERIVTKSQDNVLYEFDSQPALEIYKRYLGEKAKDLPASGLLFPISMKSETNSKEGKVRTILGVNEEDQSITFAGDIPEGSHVTLMKANFDRIVDGASDAASEIVLDGYNGEDILSIAISCVGRRLILKQRTEEELEATLEILPENTKQIGFYSYGEISPHGYEACDLHNQTMTLTTIWESDASTS